MHFHFGHLDYFNIEIFVYICEYYLFMNEIHTQPINKNKSWYLIDCFSFNHIKITMTAHCKRRFDLVYEDCQILNW